MKNEINVCAINKSFTAYVKKIEKIKDKTELNDFIDNINLSSLPYFTYTQGRFESHHYSLTFMALMSGNEPLLSFLLDRFPESLKTKLAIKEEKGFMLADPDNIKSKKFGYSNFQYFDWNNIQTLFRYDEKIKSIFLQKMAYNHEMHMVLHKHDILHNIISETLNVCGKKETLYESIIKGINDFYYSYKIKPVNSDLFYCNAELFQKNNYLHTEESYKEWKNKYEFFTGKSAGEIFTDERIIEVYFRNPGIYFLKEFFKHHDINGGKFKESNAFEGYSTESVFKNNRSLDLIKKLEPFFNDTNHPIRHKIIHDYYVEILVESEKNVLDFYKELNAKYSFRLPLHQIKTNDFDYIEEIVLSHDKPDTEGLTEKLLIKKQYDFLERLFSIENIDKEELMTNILNIVVIHNYLQEKENICELLNSLKNIELQWGKVDLSLKMKNEMLSIVESYILDRTLGKSEILSPNKSRL